MMIVFTMYRLTFKGQFGQITFFSGSTNLETSHLLSCL